MSQQALTDSELIHDNKTIEDERTWNDSLDGTHASAVMKEERSGVVSPVVLPSDELRMEPPPDGGLTAWLVVLACVYQAHYLLTVFPTESAEVISLVGSICTAFTLASGVFAGRLVEIYGVKTVTIVGSVIFSGSLVAAGFCRTVPTLLVTQAVVPWFLKKRSLVLGIISAGAGVGGICWSFLARAVIAKFSYHWALWITACISAVLNLIAIIFIKDRPISGQDQRVKQQGSSFREAFGMFRNPKFATLYCASALSVFGFDFDLPKRTRYLVPFFYVPTYAETQLNATPLVGATLSAVIDLGLSAGRILIGRLADTRFGTMNSIILTGLCQLAFWLPATNSIALLYVFSFIYGFFGGGYIGLVPAILAQIFDEDKLPSIMGLFYSSELPGELAGGPIAGAIFSGTHGRWPPVILYSAMTMFGGSLLAIITRFQVDRRLFATV
ncbi:hypothetical protein Clacol_001245 [Clathrus columnatus]|uniref:MFS general substrate transporter n=1 Tax=Clathrus columnatus TaxID=1419009 RepID=A0AAV5A209_9AGAM|nr:hypothetical protein Clacol_001245 [Clathrus columnatus]